MGILDKEERVEVAPVVRGARQVRNNLANVVNQMESGLKNVRRIVENVGKAELAAELGDDAAELQSVYSALKNCLESITDKSVDDLPE